MSLHDLAERVRDASAGLQVFLDNIPQRDSGITESIHELLLLNEGFYQLHASLSRIRFTPTLRNDIALLMKSMNLTLDRVEEMFGETKNLKLDGKRPYSYVWNRLCIYFKENEGQIQLSSRLQLYSVFLYQMLSYMKGKPFTKSTVTQQRDMLQRLLSYQVPSKPLPRQPTTDPLQTFSMPGAFPTVPDPPRPYNAPGSPSTASSTSWQTYEPSQLGSSIGSLSGHWVNEIFDGQQPSSKFPRKFRERSILLADHEPKLSEYLTMSRSCLMTRMSFEADDIEARFYCGPDAREIRLILMTHDPATRSQAICSLVKRLKVKRDKASLLFWRMDKKGSFKLWAKLCFVDIERLILFYSTFVALKAQDYSPADGEAILEDYYDVKDEQLYGGTTLYPTIHNTVLKHALRVYKDKYTNAIRIECRALRGRQHHVPLWVSFLPEELRVRQWIRRVGPGQIELRTLEQHVFVNGYVPTIGRNGRFLLDFEKNADAEDFIQVMYDHLPE